MDAKPIHVESVTHVDWPAALVFDAARTLLAREGARVLAQEPPRHIQVERGSLFRREFDELWFDEWGEGTGIRYKGGTRYAGGWLITSLLEQVARGQTRTRARRIFEALRAALDG